MCSTHPDVGPTPEPVGSLVNFSPIQEGGKPSGSHSDVILKMARGVKVKGDKKFRNCIHIRCKCGLLCPCLAARQPKRHTTTSRVPSGV